MMQMTEEEKEFRKTGVRLFDKLAEIIYGFIKENEEPKSIIAAIGSLLCIATELADVAANHSTKESITGDKIIKDILNELKISGGLIYNEHKIN